MCVELYIKEVNRSPSPHDDYVGKVRYVGVVSCVDAKCFSDVVGVFYNSKNYKSLTQTRRNYGQTFFYQHLFQFQLSNGNSDALQI